MKLRHKTEGLRVSFKIIEIRFHSRGQYFAQWFPLKEDVIQMFLKPFPDRRLSEMPKRWIPNIMDEPCTEQYITNILFHLWRKFRILPISKNILSNILTKRLGKGRNLQRMGQPGSHKVALIQRKYLGLILKPPK